MTGSFGELISTRMRVVTWNLWWRFGPWVERQPAIAATVGELDADIVCLQEVWEDDTTNQAAQLAAQLGGLSGYHHVYGSRLDLDGVRLGNAVVSRWPITSHEVRHLPAPFEAQEFRTVVRADIDGPRGPVQVFATHLNWRFDESAARQEQVRAICQFVAESPPRSYPAVVAGDFNAAPDSLEVGLMTGRGAVPVPRLVFLDAWEAAGGAHPGFTWSNTNPYAVEELEPDRRIDYVFVGWPKAGGAGHVVDVGLVGQDPIDGVVGSDHYGVRADLRY